MQQLDARPPGVHGISPSGGPPSRLELERLGDADPALREQAGVGRGEPVDVLAGGDLGQHRVALEAVGQRQLDEDAVDLGVGVEARATRATSSAWETSAASSWWIERIPAASQALRLLAT